MLNDAITAPPLTFQTDRLDVVESRSVKTLVHMICSGFRWTFFFCVSARSYSSNLRNGYLQLIIQIDVFIGSYKRIRIVDLTNVYL